MNTPKDALSWPSEGGRYTRRPDGTLKREAFTAPAPARTEAAEPPAPDGIDAPEAAEGEVAEMEDGRPPARPNPRKPKEG